MRLAVRDAGTEDEDFILALNAACDPHVGMMDRSGFRSIAAAAHCVAVATSGAKRQGFIILLRPGAAYDSDNYAWFEQRFDRHLYIDRVAVDASARGRGVGQALYAEALAIAVAHADERLTAEVNADPPNPASLAFHLANGFCPLLSRLSRSGKTVAMLERKLVS
ncbi:MAG: GNAT family N-acetyltransferase [Alphaproteobacteria bacterium]|nr:GNAT family N-acetyltransferase [Alphaproteobacteria bacterium]